MRPSNDQIRIRASTPDLCELKDVSENQLIAPITDTSDYRYVFQCPSSNNINSWLPCISDPSTDLGQLDSSSNQDHTDETHTIALRQYIDISRVGHSTLVCFRSYLIVGLISIISLIGMFSGETAASNAAVGLSEASENALSIPRWLYVATGGAAIGASALLAGFITDRRLLNRIHTYGSTLSSWHPLYHWGRHFGAAIGILLATIIIVRGLTGPQIPTVNAAIIIVFAGFRAGITIVIYAFGNVWTVLNPARSITTAIPTIPRSIQIPYPSRFGRWPALCGLFGLIWIETTTGITARPTLLALVVFGYLLVSIIGAMIFQEAWFRNIDPVSVFFRFYSRAAPLKWTNGQLRVSIPAMTLVGNSRVDPTVTNETQHVSSETIADGGANQVDTAETTTHSQSQSEYTDSAASSSSECLRESPPLIEDRSDVAVAIMLVWELTFSGFVTTTQGGAIIRTIVAGGIPPVITYLSLFIGGFITFYAAFVLAGRIASNRLLTTWSADDLTVAFAPSLIAIAVGYHLAHYVGFFLSLSPSLFDAVVSPFAPPSNPIILTLPAWISAFNIVFVLAGHLIAIWVAHSTAYQLFPSRLQAIRSQYPFIFVMMGYTIVSLWLISLPTATPPFVG